jgi:hypothetical protein
LPAAFTCRDVPCIKILFDLILTRELQSGVVITFIDVLVDILDCLDRDADFDIDVTVILDTEERIIKNNIAIDECIWKMSMLQFSPCL